MPTPLTILPSAARLWLSVRRARRRENRLLEKIGAEAGDHAQEGVQWRAELKAIDEVAARSLDEDRADYARASSWAKPLVVARGILTRWVARDRARRFRAQLRPRHRALGAAVLAGEAATRVWRRPEPPPRADLLMEATNARARREAAELERTRLLGPYGGHALPAWSRRLGRELAAIAKSLVGEVRTRLLPRWPGLVGLGAGWLVARAFTTSRWSGLMDRVGLRHGGPTVVDAATYQRLQFWVPIVVAALSGYAGSKIAALVERRYGPAPPEVPRDPSQ